MFHFNTDFDFISFILLNPKIYLDWQGLLTISKKEIIHKYLPKW